MINKKTELYDEALKNSPARDWLSEKNAMSSMYINIASRDRYHFLVALKCLNDFELPTAIMIPSSGLCLHFFFSTNIIFFSPVVIVEKSPSWAPAVLLYISRDRTNFSSHLMSIAQSFRSLREGEVQPRSLTTSRYCNVYTRHSSSQSTMLNIVFDLFYCYAFGSLLEPGVRFFVDYVLNVCFLENWNK